MVKSSEWRDWTSQITSDLPKWQVLICSTSFLIESKGSFEKFKIRKCNIKLHWTPLLHKTSVKLFEIWFLYCCICKKKNFFPQKILKFSVFFHAALKQLLHQRKAKNFWTEFRDNFRSIRLMRQIYQCP